MSILVDRLLSIHDSLASAAIPHAFGGAIALAYCTLEPRGTRDVYVNIFLPVEQAFRVLESLPSEIAYGDEDVEQLKCDGQARLAWEDMPVDLFFNNLPLHDEVAKGTVQVPFAGKEIPVLDATSLVVFKAMFDRTKDWADIEAVLGFDPDSVRVAAEKVGQLIGHEDPIYIRISGLLA